MNACACPIRDFNFLFLSSHNVNINTPTPSEQLLLGIFFFFPPRSLSSAAPLLFCHYYCVFVSVYVRLYVFVCVFVWTVYNRHRGKAAFRRFSVLRPLFFLLSCDNNSSRQIHENTWTITKHTHTQAMLPHNHLPQWIGLHFLFATMKVNWIFNSSKIIIFEVEKL